MVPQLTFSLLILTFNFVALSCNTARSYRILPDWCTFSHFYRSDTLGYLFRYIICPVLGIQCSRKTPAPLTKNYSFLKSICNWLTCHGTDLCGANACFSNIGEDKVNHPIQVVDLGQTLDPAPVLHVNWLFIP